MNDQDVANARRDARDRQHEELLKQREGLTGQQIQALAKNHADALAAIKRDIELRKWAVDQACGLADPLAAVKASGVYHPVTLAREIHAFLVEAAEKAE